MFNIKNTLHLVNISFIVEFVLLAHVCTNSVNAMIALREEYPLHAAATAGALDEVECILAKGYDINVRNRAGQTALHCAAYAGKLDIIRFLIDHRADLNPIDLKGKSPFDYAKAQNVITYLKSIGIQSLPSHSA